MKKLIATGIAFIIFCGGCFFAFQYYYGGDDYYTKITTDGKHDIDHFTNGSTYDVYIYNQEAYDAEGNQKTLEMREQWNLRHNAYLKLLVNPRKGVLSWEEVQPNEVPEQAKKILDK